jgi:hypothetical protein
MHKIHRTQEKLKQKQIKYAKELSDYLSNKSGGTLNPDDVHFLTFEMIKTDFNVSNLVDKITEISNKRQEIQEILDVLEKNKFSLKNYSN